MKTKDFDRLKAICEQEGLYFDFDPISETAVVAKLKDPWEGVEFAEYNGVILRIDAFNSYDDSRYDNFYSTDGRRIHKIDCKPSTEQAYIEQLKKEAFERFGEIKHLDNFKLPNGLQYQIPNNYGFRYFKHLDILNFSGVTIYQQGEWATKIEKVEVEYQYSSSGGLGDFGYHFIIKNAKRINHTEIGEYLAEELTKYLNNEK